MCTDFQPVDQPTKWAWMAQSLQQVATGWAVGGSNPCAGETSRTRPNRPWDPPRLLYNGYRVCFPGAKRRGVELTAQPI